MRRLTDAVCLLDPLIQIRKRRQVIHIKRMILIRHILSRLPLRLQKLLIQFKYRAFPDLLSKMPPVHPPQLFFLRRGIGDMFPGKLIFQPGEQDLIKHIDPALHGKLRHGLKVAVYLRFRQ